MRKFFVVVFALAVNVFAFAKTDSYKFKHSNNWYEWWMEGNHKPSIPADEFNRVKILGYYARVSSVNLNKISNSSSGNPENVKRIVRLMPKANFEKVFPQSINMAKINGFIPGKIYSYDNFLDAVAVIPAYCGDYSSYPGTKLSSMKDPDLICKRLLATTFTHAVQETSDAPDSSNLEDKIHRTFSSISENNYNELLTPPKRYPDSNGVFADNGPFESIIKPNAYYGRGVKQVTYPTNYANISLLLYGDLRLVKYPNLVHEERLLPFLTAIVYTVLPKDSRPSIIEVIDGSFRRDIELYSLDNVKKDVVIGYDKGFSLTIALVNGGPECWINTSNIKITENRIAVYKKFARNNYLFDVGFTPAPKELSGCSDINYNDPSLFVVSRRYYNYDRQTNSVVNWSTGIPIFGGEQVYNIFKK